jgi:hypothetical protein
MPPPAAPLTADQAAFRSAQTMMKDAFHIVTAERPTAKNFFRNAATTGIATMSTADRASLGTGLAITAGVAIAGLATGGIAIPVLIGLGAGAWALQKAISEIGNDYNRSNRNWLQRMKTHKEAGNKEQAIFLTCEAADALRRAVDHYRMMQNTIIPMELKAANETEYVTCEEVINHVKAVARFIHHGDKVRNYTLPVLDMLIFYIGQYVEIAQKWNAFERDFQQQLLAWFKAHPEMCTTGNDKECCYAPFTGLFASATATAPRKRVPEARSVPLPGLAGRAQYARESDAPAAATLGELLEGMKAAREKLVAGMHQSEVATWNYSAERPKTAHPAPTNAREHMQKARVEALLDAVWKEVDRPGYFARAQRRVGHWYTRHNKSEKLGAVVGELLGIGSIFLPAIKGASTLTDIGKSAISASVSATATLGDKIGLNIMKKELGDARIDTGLLDPHVVDAKAAEDMRGTGSTVSKLMPKLMLHFGKAAEAIKTLEGHKKEITSCSAAMGYCLEVAEIVYQMDKVGRYAGPCIGMADVLVNQCVTWTGQEAEIWRDMEAYVGEWVRDDEVHATCRDQGKKCYGAKHHRAGTNWRGAGGTWHQLTNDPHNPI